MAAVLCTRKQDIRKEEIEIGIEKHKHIRKEEIKSGIEKHKHISLPCSVLIARIITPELYTICIVRSQLVLLVIS